MGARVTGRKGRQRDEAVIQLEPVTVTGRAADLVGVAGSASQGQVGQTELDTRPLLRPGEVLEVIPGLAVTQHSGTGKANQYFLRGFNLDHGTDFSTFIDGMPVNFPTHAHGQGYMDLNFLIPEIIDTIDYKKGPYYAEVGDFPRPAPPICTCSERCPTVLRNSALGKTIIIGWCWHTHRDSGQAPCSMPLRGNITTARGTFRNGCGNSTAC